MRKMIKEGTYLHQVVELLTAAGEEIKEQAQDEGELWCLGVLLDAGQDEAFETIKRARRKRILQGLLV